MSTTGPPELNSKFAWRELFRKDLPRRSSEERLADFLEIHGLFDERTAREQASRCLQCPNPGCVTGCPLCNPIPQWIALTAEGRFLEAAAVLGSTTNMAEICSRLCHQERLCEDACVLNGVSEPVAIRALEQFLADYGNAQGMGEAAVPSPLGQAVAVVGSGPGGLACAEELVKRGYTVRVYDENLVPGGLLVNGVPAFKIERSLVQRRIESLESRGVVFHLGRRLGRDLSLNELQENHDAIYLGFDSRQSRTLRIPGMELRGVLPATSFVLQKNTALQLDIPDVSVEGKRVLVIGGGDTAIVCLRTALRYSAAEAVGVYRREEQDMPCSRDDYLAAVEEGARFLFGALPLAINGGPGGCVLSVRFAKTRPPGETGPDGRRLFEEIAGEEFDVSADVVVAAIGYEALPCPHDGEFAGFAVREWGGLIVDGNQRTNIRHVFAGGDIVRGQCSVLEAVRDARKAAFAIHEELTALRGGRRTG